MNMNIAYNTDVESLKELEEAAALMLIAPLCD